MGCTDSRPAPPKAAAKPVAKPPAAKAKSKGAVADNASGSCNNSGSIPHATPRNEDVEGKSPDNAQVSLASTRRATQGDIGVPHSSRRQSDFNSSTNSARRGSSMHVHSRERLNRRDYPQEQKRTARLGIDRSQVSPRCSPRAAPEKTPRGLRSPRGASPHASPRSARGSTTYDSPSRMSEAPLSPEMRSLSSPVPPLRFQTSGDSTGSPSVSARELESSCHLDDSDSEFSDPDSIPTHVPTLFKFIDEERYPAAYRGLTEAMKRANAVDYVLCVFGLLVLSKLSDDWLVPPKLDVLKKETDEAKSWLTVQARNGSCAAYLALAEMMSRSYGDAEKCKSLKKTAAGTNHPLALLRYNMSELADIKDAVAEGSLSTEEAERRKAPVMEEFDKLTKHFNKVGARAAKLLYPFLLKTREFEKAKNLVEMAIDLESNQKVLDKLQSTLDRILDKLDSENYDDLANTARSSRWGSMRQSVHNSSTHLNTTQRRKVDRHESSASLYNASMASGVTPRVESSRGGRSSQSPPTLTQQMLDKKERGLAQHGSMRRHHSRASLNGSQKGSMMGSMRSISPRPRETVVEVDVDGTKYGVLRASSPGPNSSRRGTGGGNSARGRRSVSAHDFDPLTDGLGGSGNDYYDDDDMCSQGGSTYRREMGQSQVSQRGRDISASLRDMEAFASNPSPHSSGSLRRHKSQRR